MSKEGYTSSVMTICEDGHISTVTTTSQDTCWAMLQVDLIVFLVTVLVLV